MTDSFQYSTTYVLDKSHFSETFDQSDVAGNNKAAYAKAIMLVVIGLAVLQIAQVSPYIGWFIIALSIVETLSVRFKKAFWLGRQLISKAANNRLTLTIDEQGIATHSHYVNSKFLWDDITRVEETAKGWLLYQGKGKSYLSNRCLSDEAIEFIRLKAEVKKPA